MKMNINMSESQFDKLTQLCKNSRDELSGTMNAQVTNGEIYVVSVNLDESNIIDRANSHEIIYNSKEYITKTAYELAFANSPVYIRFHTHPLFGGAPGLSKPDTDQLKYVQSLAKNVAKITCNDYTKVISGIVTDSEIAFYTYDLDSDRVIRIPFFVDGNEKIPSTEKSKFQIFKEGFLEGRRKAGK